MTFGHAVSIVGIIWGYQFWRGWREASLARRREQIILCDERSGNAIPLDGLGIGEKIIEGSCTRIR